MAEHDDDGIPLLDDIVRTGRPTGGSESPAPDSAKTALSEADIEAIAARVVERHTREIEQAVARAIRKALESKQNGHSEGGDG